MLARRPKCSQELILATHGCSGGCSWSFLGCSWLPAPQPNCQDDPVGLPRYRMPKSNQEVLLATPGCSWAAPATSWAAPGCPEPCWPGCPNPASFSWPFLGVGCSWNFPGPVMPCALCASMQRSCYPCVPNWDKNVMGGMGGKPRVSQKTLNPKRE